jgi:hypothetical protein
MSFGNRAWLHFKVAASRIGGYDVADLCFSASFETEVTLHFGKLSSGNAWGGGRSESQKLSQSNAPPRGMSGKFGDAVPLLEGRSRKAVQKGPFEARHTAFTIRT